MTVTRPSTGTSYTDEQAQDAVAAMIAAGVQSGLTASYNDATNALSFTVPGTFSNEQAQDAAAAMISLGSHTGIVFTYNDAANTLSATVTGAPPSGTAGGVLSGSYPNPGFAADMATQAELDAAVAAVPEQAQDATAALVAAGTHSGVSFAYNDTAGSLSATVTASGYSDEQAQDAAAAMITAGSHVGVTTAYDDALNTITFTATGGATGIDGGFAASAYGGATAPFDGGGA